ncbi:hypothetical protein COT51_02500 [candidate division WWE3 bacterium CG08_land_8_20_14_0_20_41_15]|uniref:Peptide chain release factor domain-containing protein n=2 Tax=Katanobacteria TaxID=422282 RepID=A0A2H0XBL5_UNCKA|nr:MAG: hypothetical protein COT51_02500 [candidate division WWE3 bacterium CG08_land_8_20_14_0_20_41_15]
MIETNPNKAILEIRPGTGGDEAGIFAFDLLRMYQRYASSKGWKFSILEEAHGGVGNLKSVTVEIEGFNAFKLLKNESGVHRVQRVPETERSGRIHTSTATVSVLPASSPVEIEIKPQDLKFEAYRSSSKGGQNVQKVETAVRILHIPTGLMVTCQEQRFQEQNRKKATEILKAKLYQMMQDQQKGTIDGLRADQIGSGDRSEKIKTYNFPQNRLTDHRINKSWYNLEEVINGKLDKVLGV